MASLQDVCWDDKLHAKQAHAFPLMVSLSLNWLNQLQSLMRHASQMADELMEVMGWGHGSKFLIGLLIELPWSTLSVIVDTWHCFDLFSVTEHSVPSVLTSPWNEKLPTGCGLSVLHYRANAASPVPTAVGSFTTSLPCAFPHLPQASHSQ